MTAHEDVIRNAHGTENVIPIVNGFERAEAVLEIVLDYTISNLRRANLLSTYSSGSGKVHPVQLEPASPKASADPVHVSL